MIHNKKVSNGLGAKLIGVELQSIHSPVGTSTAENTAKQGMILFCDGGCAPSNPGPGGWGIHGYLYSNEKPKKGSGNSDVVLTTKGYLLKSETALGVTTYKEITPIHYLDGYGSFALSITNNVAELEAAINGLVYAKDFDIKELRIITDSEYVVGGFNKWMDGWASNNWIKPDRSERANAIYWKRLIEARDHLINRGATVKIEWIRSHSGHLGNEMADKLATIGVLHSRAGICKSEIVKSVAEGYWKYTSDKHPLLANRRMYFNTLSEYNTAGTYYLGDHGNDDDMLGKRLSDGAYAVVMLEKPDNVLETIRNYQITLAKEDNRIITTRLDHIYRPATHKELSLYGIYAMEQHKPYRLDLRCLDEEPLTRELQPAKIAMRAVESIGELIEKLDEYLVRDKKIIITDLTHILYEEVVKLCKKNVNSTETKLKPEFNVGYAALTVDAR